ncbi:Kcnk3 [Symbiodinium natans]|uniref:Kcnk3 protein n=1 Tax=Symbiodinium natans TaxID=878477 RepID=A0A812I8I2_9DINO|nr:Kcnk3 [Symbiodinium natans]
MHLDDVSAFLPVLPMFSFTLVASIGYGNIAPATDAGRVFCMVFTLVATPALVVAYLGAARKMIDFTRVIAMLFNKKNILTFHKYDTDGSGQLDFVEFGSALRDLGYPVAESDVNLIMEEVNICDTSLVTIQEFGQALILLEFPSARQEKHRLSAMISFSTTLTWLLAGAALELRRALAAMRLPALHTTCMRKQEAIWFCWETLMTIGLGWFTLAYSFLGLGFISVLLQSIVDLLSKHSSIIGRLEMRLLEARTTKPSCPQGQRLYSFLLGDLPVQQAARDASAA